MKILYAGDSPAGGPANYLLAVLRFLKAKTVHFAPDEKLQPRHLKTKFDAILFSDFSKKQVALPVEKLIAEQVRRGTGFMMVGGWGSFSGPFGGWRGSLIEREILPVNCAKHDDRLNFPGGAAIISNESHSMFRGVNFKNSPVLVGINQITPKKNSRVILSAKKIIISKSRIALDSFKHPLLVISRDSRLRAAAFATDFAPHWCGGMVDWGKKQIALPVRDNIRVEIGDSYLRFAASLIRWLSGK